ncbi:Uncharacterised protein [Corynebacterium kutscheri]|uniref:Uncharacterized protein n=1 Tax=Corynebacterium kutscheri TaxID=35755 RepID=A0A0F6QYP9_9CORY|nr:HEPN domain-containing protein [Corynebacterium kutscheri]AKE40280.1 hypothetical protein UL82_00185 [Corynebacterium kutscheri]VEH10672.1 Uncharacterised protein [Corynebacterium kutscheri]VEH81419.1 Uncharacterised protein [Corynebacterium kutscheri]
MIRNTEPRSWHGTWYLPESDQKHWGVLNYEPEGVFQLTIMSEGFGNPWEEIDHPSTKTVILRQRDISTPYPAVYGEADGRFITLFDVYTGGSTQKYASQAAYSEATYYPQTMIIGAHIPSMQSEVLRSLSISFDFLHIWLEDSGWLKVGTTWDESGSRIIEHFCKVETEIYDRPMRCLTVDDETAITIDYYGTLPDLKWSAFEYESRSRISASIKLTNIKNSCSLKSFQPKIFALETLLSICLDRPCKPFAFKCELWNQNRLSSVEILIPRRGSIPSKEPSGQYLEKLSGCEKNRDFNYYFEKWFPFYEQHYPALSLLNGFLANDDSHFLETSVMLAQTLVETFHKSMFGKKYKDLLPESIEAAERLRPGRSPQDKKKVTTFKRAIDLSHRLPAEVRDLLIPDEGKWAGSLVDARNDIAHDGNLRKVEIFQAHAAAKIAIAVVTIHVLIQLGTETESLLKLLNDRNSLSKAKELASDYLV